VRLWRSAAASARSRPPKSSRTRATFAIPGIAASDLLSDNAVRNSGRQGDLSPWQERSDVL